MGGSAKHVATDVQKSVQADGKGNEDNCIEGGGISTTMCIKGMVALIYSFMYIKFNYHMKYWFSIVLLQKQKQNGTHSAHRTWRQGRKRLIAKFVSTYVFAFTN